MTIALRVSSLRTSGGAPLQWGLSAFVWLLPFHILVMAFLFGALGWPAPVVRVIAAWKEALIALLFVLALVRVATGAGPRIEIRWFDLAFGGLIALGLAYLVGAGVWFDAALPAGAQLYGFRDVVLVTLLYFVGRACPEAVETARCLRSLYLVGVVTSAIAIVERLLVGPELLVLLGAARYMQDFLGVAAATTGNVYGLPDNYWTLLGDHLVRRVGSTYLSAQGFAIPFLLLMPAATLWLTSTERRQSALTWLGYAAMWIALLLTVTRMTIVACVAQALLILALRRRWDLLIGGAIAGALAFVALLPAIPGLARYVLETLTWETGSSVSHLEDWKEGLENFLRYPFGVGLGATGQTAMRYRITPLAADNQYLKLAVELGVVGLGLHLATLAAMAAAGLGAWRRGQHPALRDAGLLVAVTTLGIALNAWTAVVFSSMILAYISFWLGGSVATATPRRADAP